MTRRLLTLLTLALVAGCSSNSPTAPTGGGSGGGPQGGNGDGGGDPAPATAAVIVGNNFFRSGQDGSNPGTVTVAVGGTVTWTWTDTGGVPHSVQSLGSPSFTSSEIQAGNGSTYRVTFTEPGTYRYDCAVHGTMMSGTVVVR